MLPCVLTLRFRDVSLFEASVVGQCFYCKLHLLLLLLLRCCFTSTETVGSLGTGAQDGHLDFHTAPELCGTADGSTGQICCGVDVVASTVLVSHC